MLTPIRLAPAAPANEPFGIAWATNAEPRSTTKKPTSPATTATIVATIQALTMKPENIASASPRCRRAREHPRRTIEDDQDERDDEEADRPAVAGGGQS